MQRPTPRWSSFGALRSVANAEDGLLLAFTHGSVLLDCPSEGALRLRFDGLDRPRAKRSWALTSKAKRGTFTLTSASGTTVAKADGFVVTLTADPFQLTITDDAGHVLLDGVAEGLAQRRGDGLATALRMTTEERVYGLGEKSGPMNRRGRVFSMWNTDAFAYEPRQDPLYKSIPFALRVSEGKTSGLFLDHPGRTTFDVGVRHQDVLELSVPSGPLELTVLRGPTPESVLDRYTRLTGRPVRVPLWALGYQQCRYSYFPEARVLELARTFREKRIPCDVLYLDIHYMDGYRSFTYDPHRFPRMKEMIDSLHKDGFKVIVIIDPGLLIDEEYAPYTSGVARDVFLRSPEGEIHAGKVWPGLCAFPDFLRDDVRAWWGPLYAPLVDAGIDGFWNDMNEPAILEAKTKTVPLDLVHHVDGEPVAHEDVHNVYGAEMIRATYDGITALRPERRALVMTRAAYAGTQRVATAWSGDNRSCWEDLRQSISMVVSMGLSGFPIYGPDLGGFTGTPEPELVTRWLQLGAFFGVMRMHTYLAAPDQEPWSYGEEREALHRDAIALRYELLPTWYSLAHEASDTGLPPLRPCWLRWPEHSELGEREDQFLLGDALLVAPATRAAQHYRDVRLPPGRWMDLVEGTLFEGGHDVVVPCPEDRIPLFLRAGYPLFRQAVVQSTASERPDILLVDFLLGGDGEAVLTEDHGDGPATGEGLRRETRFRVKSHADGASVTLEEISALALRGASTIRLRIHGFAECPKSSHGHAEFAEDVAVLSVDRSSLPLAIRFTGPLRMPAKDEAFVFPTDDSNDEIPLAEDRHVRATDGWTPRPLPTSLRWSYRKEDLTLVASLELPEHHVPPRNSLEDGLVVRIAGGLSILDIHVPFDTLEARGERPDGVMWTREATGTALIATVTIPAKALGLLTLSGGRALSADIGVRLSDRSGWQSELAWRAPRWDKTLPPPNLHLVAQT